MKTVDEILEAIAKLPNQHVLRTAPDSYAGAFANAAIRVYPEQKRARILQEKFFIPNASGFKLDSYLESAAELSVQNHIALAHKAKNVDIEKKVNPPKDVDSYYEVGQVRVSVEVKCPLELTKNPSTLTIRQAGRLPNHKGLFEDLKSQLETVNPSKEVDLAKNKDLTLKDFLLSAHGKFNPKAGSNELNALLIACGDYFNMQEWHFYLFQNNGLFTDQPFHPPANFELVDVVILTSLKYSHSIAREYHDWTLDNVFILPFLNPKRRKSAQVEAIQSGLGVFDHHMERFSKYEPFADEPNLPAFIPEGLKVNYYVVEHLPEAERSRYFPIKPT